MRRSWQSYILAALFLNFLVLVYLAFQQHQVSSSGSIGQPVWDIPSPQPLASTNITQDVTIIIREFEDFDNDLIQTALSLQEILGPVKVYIIGDTLPYPPINIINNCNCEVVSLQTDLLQSYLSTHPDYSIKTKYILILPDATKLKHKQQLQTAIRVLGTKGRVKAVAIGIESQIQKCTSIRVDLKRWTLTLESIAPDNLSCHMKEGKHAILMLTSDFKSLALPFSRPFTLTFYIQASLRQWKIKYLNGIHLVRTKNLFSDPHNLWKHKSLEKNRLSDFYKQAGIKLVQQPDGTEEYFGCSKFTPRCFGTIVDDMPDYLYQEKWTPPCCLKALRQTARYVFEILDKAGVRYWLEGGSLLGAARNGDIIPWDYDVDIGIYKDDINKSSHLRDAMQESFVDEYGFVWEKATDGDFFRVQYSEKNHLHVDIHPFYSRNGTMTKDTWFKTHRQDTEFPEHFLKPMTRIGFVGSMAGAPNNMQEFLEFKFGKDVISQPRLPNFKKVQMHKL